jgi:DNA-directed RNA polymerase subunit beta
VLVRSAGGGGDVEFVESKEVDYMDVSPKQIVSVSTSLIPFLEHDDANRALMGSNMQRQAVPLLTAEAPLVGTGVEGRAAQDSGDMIVSRSKAKWSRSPAIRSWSRRRVQQEAHLRPRQVQALQPGHLHEPQALVYEGDKVKVGDVLADGPSTESGELALGRNLLVAFMPWQGHNFEDAIVISERLVKDDVLTSIHIEEHEIDARDTKLGAEEITRDIPNVPKKSWPTSTTTGSSGSAPRSAPATTWWARSLPRVRPN